MWEIICSLLLFLMVMALGLMGSGVVRFKNSLSQLIQSVILLPHSLIIFRYIIYPTVFPEGESYSLDFLSQFFFFAIAQMILIGVWAERMRFSRMLIFVSLWGVVIYWPMAYLNWHHEGYFYKSGIIDFAGGLVVHVTTGFSALAMTYLARRRADYYKLIKNYNNPQIFIGVLLLWFGWFGFNGGSATSDNQELTLINTFLCPVVSLGTWFWIDLIHTPHRSYLSHLCMAIVAGLVIITPSAGLIGSEAAIILGVLGGAVANYSVRFMHKVFNQDDVMEVFSTHGLVGLLGTVALVPFTPVHLHASFKVQAIGAFSVALYSFLGTTLLIKALSLRRLLLTGAQEEKGLDLIDHGEYVENRPLGKV